MENSSILTALLMSSLAGLSTLVGGLSTFLIKKDNLKALSLGLGFSAGVMIYVSLVEMLPEAMKLIVEQYGQNHAYLAILCFFIGMVISILTDKFLPEHVQDDLFVKQLSENNTAIKEIEEICHEKPDNCATNKDKRNKMGSAGLVTAIAVAAHNFPEGLATFFAASTNMTLGISIVTAIAIHNIPEGIAIALPIREATGSKRKALKYTFLSGMAEPVGGLFGFLFLRYFFPDVTVGFMFALVAGIMTYISFDTLLPLSRECDTGHYSMTGVVIGMIIMGLSLLLF